MVISAMKKTFYYFIFLFLSLKVILNDPSFCQYPNKFQDNFPDLGESEKFYLKKNNRRLLYNRN